MTGREVVVGVTGGVAAYKTAALVSRLAQAGCGVSVVLTAAAKEFVGSATFAALSGRPVREKIFDEALHPLGAHIELARGAELLCIAPATANFLAKAALGLADDLLSTLVLSFSGPVLLAPAMNSQMWAKPTVQRNVALLRDDGFHFVDPTEGWLSCRDQGAGRMAEPEAIFAAIERLLLQTRSAAGR
jgi:phosphopantothenoylcysteine decarboxylase/phosphopantothenate--cysteine ligase